MQELGDEPLGVPAKGTFHSTSNLLLALPPLCDYRLFVTSPPQLHPREWHDCGLVWATPD